MSTCLAFCTTAPPPAAVWALTPLTVGLALNAVGLAVAITTAIRATRESRQARAATGRALAQSRREQAGKVAAWTVVESNQQDEASSSSSRCHVRMANRSDLPVTQVTAVLSIPRNTHSILREVLGPGETWDDPMDFLSHEQAGADFPVLSTAFTDAEGQRWVRDRTGLHHAKEDDTEAGTARLTHTGWKDQRP